MLMRQGVTLTASKTSCASAAQIIGLAVKEVLEASHGDDRTPPLAQLLLLRGGARRWRPAFLRCATEPFGFEGGFMRSEDVKLGMFVRVRGVPGNRICEIGSVS